MLKTATPGQGSMLSARVEASMVGPCRLLMLKTAVDSVVSWRGSFVTNPDIGRGDLLVQMLTAALLDKGTRSRDRFAIAQDLENRGALINFASDRLRMAFSGRALQRDIPDVLRITAESLREPLLGEEEFMKAKANHITAIQQVRDNTAAQAQRALLRVLFSETHPHYVEPETDTLRRLDTLGVHMVHDYHAAHFGGRGMVLVCVGDIDLDATRRAVEEIFEDWSAPALPAAYTTEAQPDRPGQTHVPMQDKQNLDVRMGHGLEIRRADTAYIPLSVGMSILGGNFSARLMQRIREEMGLTYGIYAQIAGVDPQLHGYVLVGVTLSRENLAFGLEATQVEVRRFVEEGPTEGELGIRKATICGAYKVGLETTVGLAGTLYRHAVHGFDVAYLDHFPEEVTAVTRRQVRDAVTQYLRPDAFHTTIAGTVEA